MESCKKIKKDGKLSADQPSSESSRSCSTCQCCVGPEAHLRHVGGEEEAQASAGLALCSPFVSSAALQLSFLILLLLFGFCLIRVPALALAVAL